MFSICIFEYKNDIISVYLATLSLIILSICSRITTKTIIQRIKEQLGKQAKRKINKMQRRKQTLSKNLSILQAKEKTINLQIFKERTDNRFHSLLQFQE